MSTAIKTALSRLADIVGDSSVSSDPAELRAYEVDGKTPGAIAKPGSAAEVVEVVKFAVSEKLAIIPTGARTKLQMGMTPRQYDVALDMTRLDRVVAFDPADLTLGVEPGVPLRKLSATLAEHKQFLPLAVPFLQQTTIGGTVASGVDTPLRQFYGTARDYVLGMEFVSGEGVIGKSGGTVVKNVSGYDMHKLMIGALGTLGVITRINFKTFPLPVAIRAFVALFDTADRAINMRHSIAQSPLTPMTLDILSPRVADLFASDAAARIAEGQLPANLVSPKHWAMTVGFTGNEKVLQRYERDLRRMAEEAGAVRIAVLGDDVRPAAFARKREFIPIALVSSPAATILKISVLPIRMKDVLDESARIAEKKSLPWAAMARGLGIIYFVLLPTGRNEETERAVTQATDETLSVCTKFEGTAWIPWCPSEWKSKLKVWGLERGDSAQMPKVKKVFDPHGVFAPGRFTGGL
jgi:glycolate oxidase FAD binding subunit